MMTMLTEGTEEKVLKLAPRSGNRDYSMASRGIAAGELVFVTRPVRFSSLVHWSVTFPASRDVEIENIRVLMIS